MEKYIINGKEFEFDTFDLDNIELFQSEAERLEEKVRAAPRDGDTVGFMRERTEDILDFFDTVVGEGTSAAAFGGKVNIKDIMSAYRQFAQDIKANANAFFGSFASKPAPVNREQRRAAEREQRRQQARQRAAEKAKPVTDEA